MTIVTSSRTSIARSLIGTGSVNILALLLGLITGVLSARGLAPSDRGLLVAIVTWVGLCGALALVGLDEAIIFHSRGRMDRAMALRRGLRRPAAGQALIGTTVLGVITWKLVSPASTLEWCIVLVTALSVPLNTVNLLGLAPLRAAEYVGLWNLIRIIPNLVYATAMLIFVLTGTLTLAAGVTALAGGVALTAVAVSVALRNYADEPSGQHNDVAGTRSYGRRLAVAVLPMSISPRVDQLLMSLCLSSATLGVYSVAAAVGGIVQILGTSLEQVLFPRMLVSEQRRKTQVVLAIRACAVAIGASLVLLAIARPLIGWVYGAEYVDAVVPLAIVLGTACVRVGASVLTAALKAHGQLAPLTAANVVGLLVSVVTFPVGAQHGMRGVATTALMGAVVTATMMTWTVFRGPRGGSA